MKFSFSFAVAMLVLGFCVPAKAADLSPYDATTKWAYPYNAPAYKEKQIKDGVALVLKAQPGIPVSKFIEALGPADQVTDLKRGFQGMSPEEDSMLVRNRQFLSHRLVWYIAKNSAGHNLKDIWISAYVGNGDDKVMQIVRNNLK